MCVSLGSHLVALVFFGVFLIPYLIYWVFLNTSSLETIACR